MKAAGSVLIVAITTLLLTAISAEAQNSWEFGAAVNLYTLPDHTYLDPLVSADRNRLHLEARYNYEDLETGSVFVGCNFSTGSAVELSFTPMIGGVIGSSNGVAPGFLLEVNYRNMTFSSEGEYLFSTDDKESSFFYSWSELAYSPADWIWFGVAGQRTRAYRTDLDIQRGLLLGFGGGNIGVTGYLMNPDRDNAFGVLTLEYRF